MEHECAIPLALATRGDRDYVHSADLVDGLVAAGVLDPSRHDKLMLRLIQPIRVQTVMVRGTTSKSLSDAVLARISLSGTGGNSWHYEVRASSANRPLDNNEDETAVRAIVSDAKSAVLDPGFCASSPYLHTATEMVKAVHRAAFSADQSFWVAGLETDSDWLSLPAEVISTGLYVQLETPMRRGMTRSSIWLHDRQVATLHFRVREKQ